MSIRPHGAILSTKEDWHRAASDRASQSTRRSPSSLTMKATSPGFSEQTARDNGRRALEQNEKRDNDNGMQPADENSPGRNRIGIHLHRGIPGCGATSGFIYVRPRRSAGFFSIAVCLSLSLSLSLSLPLSFDLSLSLSVSLSFALKILLTCGCSS